MAGVTLPPPTGPPVVPSAGAPAAPSLPAPAVAAPPSSAPGWYDDPWDPRGLRWWDGDVWTGYTDQHFAPAAAAGGPLAAGRVRATVGPTRVLALLLPLSAAGQVASLATSSSGLHQLMDQVRNGTTTARAPVAVTGWMAAGQVLSFLTIAVLVLRMVWLLRSTRAARELGDPTRRSPIVASLGWVVPLLNLWWPYGAMADLHRGDPEVTRTLRWWWITWLVGVLGGTGALVLSWSLPVPGAVAVMGLPAASWLVSGLLERRLVLAAHRAQMTRVGLNSG